MTDGHQDLLGERIERALQVLAERSIADAQVMEMNAPRGGHAAGHLRAVRIDDGGRRVLAARFPDEVESES